MSSDEAQIPTSSKTIQHLERFSPNEQVIPLTDVSHTQASDNMAIPEEIDILIYDRQDTPVMKQSKAATISTNVEADLVARSSFQPEVERPLKRQKITREEPTAQNAKSLNDVINAIQNVQYGFIVHADTTARVRTSSDQANSMPEFLQMREHQGIVKAFPVARKASTKRPTPSQSTEPEHLWINSPAIKNPAWYEDAICTQLLPKDPIAVLASLHLCQERSLVRNLEQVGLEIVERESPIQGTDLVVSASTAILFRQLRTLPTQITDMMQNLKLATTYFSRVIVVFEVVSYGVMEKQVDTMISSIDPLSPTTLATLSALRRSIAVNIVPGMSGTIGVVELVFATQGATEVSRALAAILDSEAKRLETLIGVKLASEVCGHRQWLGREGVSIVHSKAVLLIATKSEDESGLVDQYGINSFSALYILHRFDSFLKLVEELNEDQRKEFLGPVIGEEVIVGLDASLPLVPLRSCSFGSMICSDQDSRNSDD